MATIQMVNKCKDFIERIEREAIKHNVSFRCDFDETLKFFGIVAFVDEGELPKLGKAIQCRHEKEDFLLRALYPESKAYFERILFKNRAIHSASGVVE